jgi:hypothetical protein
VGGPPRNVELVTSRSGTTPPPAHMKYAYQNIGEVNGLSHLRLQYSDFLHTSGVRGGGKCPDEERST